MPEVINAYKGSELAPWIVKVRKRNPQTDKWEDDDLSDVSAVVATLTDEDTGTDVFTDQPATADVANSEFDYQPVAADVDTAGYFSLRFKATRGGKPHILPASEDNIVYVRIWE